MYHAVEHGSVLLSEFNGCLMPLLEVEQCHQLRVLCPEVIFRQDHSRHGFQERDARLKKCDSLSPVKSRLEITLHDVCQPLEEEEPQDLLI